MIIQTMDEDELRVSRSIEFSMAHFYRQDLMSEAENLRAFGPCFTPHGHGHNYRLEVLVEGRPQLESGLLLSRATFDAYLKEAVRTLDHRHANFDVPEFEPRTDGRATLIPTTENLCLYLVERLKVIFASESQCRLVSVKLNELSDLWVEWTEADACLNLDAEDFAFLESTFEVGFRVSRDPELSRAHHYRLRVTLRRESSAHSTSNDEIEAILRKQVFDRFDGKSWIAELPDISQYTNEMILFALGKHLRTSFESLAKIALYDGDNGHVEMRVLN